jgi:hypothetical protein
LLGFQRFIHPVTGSQRVKVRGELHLHRVTSVSPDEYIYRVSMNYSPGDGKSTGESLMQVAISRLDFNPAGL